MRASSSKPHKHAPSTMSWRKRKVANRRSEKNKKQPGWYEVVCATHGTRDKKRPWPTHKVGMPRTKAQRFRGGCPLLKGARSDG